MGSRSVEDSSDVDLKDISNILLMISNDEHSFDRRLQVLNPKSVLN